MLQCAKDNPASPGPLQWSQAALLPQLSQWKSKNGGRLEADERLWKTLQQGSQNSYHNIAIAFFEGQPEKFAGRSALNSACPGSMTKLIWWTQGSYRPHPVRNFRNPESPRMILLVLALVGCHTVPYSMAAQSLLPSQQLMSATCIYNSPPNLIYSLQRAVDTHAEVGLQALQPAASSSKIVNFLHTCQFTRNKHQNFKVNSKLNHETTLTFQGLKLGFSKDQLPVIL